MQNIRDSAFIEENFCYPAFAAGKLNVRHYHNSTGVLFVKKLMVYEYLRLVG